jgi:predicted lipoprotein with Yx(FWY)xxD motif
MLRFPHQTLLVAGTLAVVALFAGCGGGSGSPATTQSSPGSAANPASKLSIANVSGVGPVVVAGNGRTVYVLTSGGHTNLPCTAASGCTKLWPTLPLPSTVSAATAGTGVKASLLGTKTVGGKTYPTYNGWLIYEYTGDSGPGLAKGQGIKSFGGTWYALNASGTPVASSSGGSSGTTGSTSSGGGGWG